jgi:hypothetical protein
MSWWLAGLAALTLSGEAVAQPAAAVPAQTASYSGGCAPGAAPMSGLCTVVGTASVGEAGGKPVTWALYDVMGGEGRQALSVLLAPDGAGRDQIVARLPVSAEAVERWREEPYVVAAIIKRADVDYAAMSVRGDDGPSAFSVHRVDPAGWTLVDSTGLWPAVGSKLTSLTRSDCYVVAGDINWRSFGLRYDLMSDEGACGTAFLDLGVENGAMKIVSAMAVKPDLTPRHRRRGRR